MIDSKSACLTLLILNLAIPCYAQEAPKGPRPHPASEQAAPRGEQAAPHAERPVTASDDKISVTSHQIVLNGQVLKYDAAAGTLLLKDEAGTPRGSFFFVAYTQSHATVDHAAGEFDPAKRPITFIFNGGPGAAAVWLHLGAIGPQRLPFADDGDVAPVPAKLVDNMQTWLDVSDLVFIDPIGTGFSRAAPGVKPEEFFGVDADISSIAAFIRLYTTRNNRWLSPKFLAGESYGTTRAAGLSDYLLGEGIALNGIIFISTVLDFQTLEAAGSNDLPYVLDLPTFAAAAIYHKKLSPDLQQDMQKTLAEVRQWAMTDYLVALAAGDRLTPQQRTAVIERLARYTSLAPDFIDKRNLRISADAFRKMLLHEQKKVIGRYDARLTADDARPASTDWTEMDPGLPNYLAAYTAAINDYVRRALNFESDLTYEVLSGKVHPWNMQHGEGYLDLATTLSSAMRSNSHMKLFFASGYYDLATPFLGTDYTLDHMNLSPELRGNICRGFYPGGHMVYHPAAGREKLKTDVADFIHWAAPAIPPATQPKP